MLYQNIGTMLAGFFFAWQAFLDGTGQDHGSTLGCTDDSENELWRKRRFLSDIMIAMSSFVGFFSPTSSVISIMAIILKISGYVSLAWVDFMRWKGKKSKK